MSTTEDALEAELAAVTEDDTGLEITVRLHNAVDRALHYVGAVRALDYDEAAGRLTVRLSDVGREVVPGAANVRPPMRYVDPGADAEVTFHLPAQITKLAPDPGGDDRKVAFERQRIADASEIVVEVAWADVPFYEDPRQHDDLVLPSVRWQQHSTRATFRRGGKKGT